MVSFTTHQQLEKQTNGQASWDDGLNANVDIGERGYHFVATAGIAISSGQMVLVNSAGFAVPHDARSVSNYAPQGVAYKNCNSGDSVQFISNGIIQNSAYSLIPGRPVYSSPNSLGWPVNSYAGHGQSAGFAINATTLRFNPGFPQIFPEYTTETQTIGPVLVNTYGAFAMSLANRGIARQVRIVTSCNAYKVQFFSGSANVSSEALYETLTQSSAVGSVDVTTTTWLDQAMFPWYNTDTASPALVFGKITCQSGTSVNSVYFGVTVQVERFR